MSPRKRLGWLPEWQKRASHMRHSGKANSHIFGVCRLAIGYDKDFNFVRTEMRHQHEVYGNVCAALIASIEKQQPNWHISRLAEFAMRGQSAKRSPYDITSIAALR